MFTYEDFRTNAELRTELSQFLNSDIGRIVLRVLRDKFRAIDVPSTVDALASARILSQLHGAQTVLDDLENLTMPPGLDQREVPMTYQAPDTDQEHMPSEAEMRPQIRVPTHMMPETPLPEESPNA
jgi:hypothetical protein